jgi:hypothetical protein
MVGQQTWLPRDPLRVEEFQCLGDPPVQRPPSSQRQAFVGCLEGQLVLKSVLPLRHPCALANQLLPLQRKEALVKAFAVGDFRQKAVGEDPPDNSCELEHVPSGSGQPVDSGAEHSVQGVWYADLIAIVGWLPSAGHRLTGNCARLD